MTDNQLIESTDRTPKVELSFEANEFSFSGYSYPENVEAFYGPIMNDVSAHLASQANATFTFNFYFAYYHSSTAQVLYQLFDRLVESQQNGNSVIVNWSFDEDDDTMEEAGEDLAEEFESFTFNVKQID